MVSGRPVFAGRVRGRAGAALVATVCDGDDDRQRAEAAAERSIHAASDEHLDRLEGMAIDPKAVC